MRIFDLFKKIAKEKKVEEIVIEKLEFSEIDNWILDKIKDNQLKQNKIISSIKDVIKRYDNELNEKINFLKDFDVDAKKEKGKIKEIVKQGRRGYIESVENFLEKLNNLEINDLKDLLKK